MIIDSHVKFVEKMFKLAPRIRDAVLDERAQRIAKHHACDPTGERVVAKHMPIKRVRVSTERGGLVIENPEDWMEVFSEIYIAYSNHPIAAMARSRLEDNKSPAAIAELMGVSRECYYGWYREFLRDAVFVASSKGLLKEMQKSKM